MQQLRYLGALFRRLFRHSLGLLGAAALLVPAFKAVKELVGLGGSVDFILSRMQDPAWVGVVLTFLINLPAWSNSLLILIGLLLIWLDLKRPWSKLPTAAKLVHDQHAIVQSMPSRAMDHLADDEANVRLALIKEINSIASDLRSDDFDEETTILRLNKIHSVYLTIVVDQSLSLSFSFFRNQLAMSLKPGGNSEK